MALAAAAGLVLRLSRTFAHHLNEAPAESPVTVNGRPTARYRVDTLRDAVRTVGGGPLHRVWDALTTLPDPWSWSPVPEIVSGAVDIRAPE